METNVWELLLAVGLPTAIVSGVVGMLFWRLKQWETQRKEEQEKRDVARRELELWLSAKQRRPPSKTGIATEKRSGRSTMNSV